MRSQELPLTGIVRSGPAIEEWEAEVKRKKSQERGRGKGREGERDI